MLVNDNNLVSSNGETRRLVKQGGFKMNSEKTTDANMGVRLADEAIIEAEERRFVRVIIRVESVG